MPLRRSQLPGAQEQGEQSGVRPSPCGRLLWYACPAAQSLARNSMTTPEKKFDAYIKGQAKQQTTELRRADSGVICQRI